jgi:predicted nucleic acid-binding protein
MPWRTSIATRGVPTTNDPAPPWGGARYLVDNSVWQRTDKPAIRDLWVTALRRDQIATCPINRAEILWSARNLANFDQIRRTLGALDNYELLQEHWDGHSDDSRRSATTEQFSHRIYF